MGFVKIKLINPIVARNPLDGRVRRQISWHQMKLVNAIRTANPFVGPALHAMAFALTSGGIRVRKKRRRKTAGAGSSSSNPKTNSPSSSLDSNEELTDDLKELLQREWLPFCEHVLEDIITFGFVIIALDVTRKVPYVRNPLDCFQRIEISTDIHGLDRTYELTMREEGMGFTNNFLLQTNQYSGTQSPEHTAPPMFVLECWPPGADGDLMSLCRTLIPLDSFMQTIMQCQITVGLRNARPLLITSTEKQNVDKKNVARDIGAAGDSAIVHRDQGLLAHRIHFEAKREDAQALRALNEDYAQSHMDANQRRIKQLAGGQSWMGVMQTNTLGGSSGATPVNNAPLLVNPTTGTAEFPAMVGALQYEGSMIPLPPNTNLEKTPEAKGAEPYLTEMWEIFRDTTLMALGVPPVLWGSTSSSVAGNLVVINTYNDTKHHYRVILKEVIEACFLQLFGVNELKYELRRKLERKIARRARRELLQTRMDQKGKIVPLTPSEVQVAEDDDADGEDTFAHIEVSFPGVLDMEQIAAVDMMGLMTHEGKRRYVSMYLGIPEDDLAAEPMDPLTGKPQSEVQQEGMEREDQVMQNQARLGMSVKAPSKSGVGKKPAQKKPKTMGTRN